MGPLEKELAPGKVFRMEPLLAFDALDLLPVVLCLAAPFTKALGAELGEGAPSDGEVTAEALAGSVAVSSGALLDSLGVAFMRPELRGQMRTFAKALAGRSYFMKGDLPQALSGETPFELAFGGDLPTMIAWLTWGLEVNYLPFFVTALQKLFTPKAKA